MSAFPEATMQMNHVCCQELPLLNNVSASCKDWLCSVNKWLFILWALSACSYSIHNYLLLSRLRCTIPLLPWRGCELWGESGGNALDLVHIWYIYIACIINRDWVPDVSFHVILTLPHLSQPGAFSLSPFSLRPFPTTWGVMTQPDLWSCYRTWHNHELDSDCWDGITTMDLIIYKHFGKTGELKMTKVRNQVLEENHFLKLKINFFLHRIAEISVRNSFCSKTSLRSVFRRDYYLVCCGF